MKRFQKVWMAVALLGLVVSFGCGKKEQATSAPEETTGRAKTDAAPSSPAAQQKKQVDAATAGTISGKVLFQGTPPKQEIVDRSLDPACLKTVPGNISSSNVVVNSNGTLRNVFVYIKSGLSGYSFPPPTVPVKLDQKGCWYIPHVLGIQVGQTLEISSNDPTLHNVDGQPQLNPAFNDSEKEGQIVKQVFNVPEEPFKIKCDVHPWMNAYLGVVEHPYYAVTGDDGTFTLKNVPPGQYTVEAWHEVYDPQTQTITLKPKETQTITFTFKAEQ